MIVQLYGVSQLTLKKALYRQWVAESRLPPLQQYYNNIVVVKLVCPG